MMRETFTRFLNEQSSMTRVRAAQPRRAAWGRGPPCSRSPVPLAARRRVPCPIRCRCVPRPLGALMRATSFVRREYDSRQGGDEGVAATRRGSTMPKAYVILTEAIHDQETMDRYGRESARALVEFGGKDRKST